MDHLSELKAAYIATLNDAQAVREKVNPLREALEQFIAGYTEEWEKQHAELLAENERLSRDATKAETALREAIKAQYIENLAKGITSKTFGNGLSVQVRTKFTVRDEAKAITWAKQYAPILIKESIDVKALESFTGSKELDFVETVEAVSAVIKF